MRLTTLQVQVVFVAPGHGTGLQPAIPDRTATYNGQTLVLQF